MTRLIVFNKRRSGEVTKMPLANYVNRPLWNESGNREILETLNTMELRLCERMDMVQVMGKCNRRVPILIPDDCQPAMKWLVQHRSSFSGIPENNAAFFATVSENGHLDGWQTLHKVAQQEGCEKAYLVTSTRLRKYIATVCQVLVLKDGELQWLSNHLGHEVQVHRDFYRLHESQVEMSKVAKLLLAVDHGKISQYKGKSLDEVDMKINGITGEKDDVQRGLIIDDEEETDDSDRSDDEQDKTDSDEDVCAGDNSDEAFMIPKKRRRAAIRKPWAGEDVAMLRTIFPNFKECYPSSK